jgi:Undecaprenyl-phosphate glucose phosphotransferase
MSIARHDSIASNASAPRRTVWLRAAFTLLAGATDAAAIVLVSVGSGILYHRFAYQDIGNITEFVQIGLLTAWLYLIPNAFLSEYSVTNYLEFKRHPERVARLWSVTFVCLMVLGFLTKSSEAYSRGWLILFFVNGLPAIIFIHAILVQAIAAGSRIGLLSTKRLYLVGEQGKVQEFIRRYKPWKLGLEIVGTFYLLPPPQGDGTSQAPRQLSAELDRAVATARSLNLDGVFVIAPWSDQETINRCIEAFMTVPTSIYLAPERLLDRLESVAIEQIGPIASLHLLRPPLSLSALVVKRVFDFVLASAGLLILLPLFAVIAIAIKLDSRGPIFFLQRRYGFNQEMFRIVKFRSMTTLDDGPVVRQAAKHDDRVTRVGKFMRRWNIDELPQLINVLLGQMSLVGPRPHALAHDRAWAVNVALYARRHNVKPGITGWAQVNGFRGNIHTEDELKGRIACDLYYIDNWSVWLDVRILFATFVWPKAYQNAY